MKKSIFRRLYERRVAIFLAVFACAFLAVPFMAMAADQQQSSNLVSGAGSVPWDNALDRLISALSGNTALYISMVGLFFAGGILIFGGELGSFTRMVMMVVLVGSVLAGVSSLVLKFIAGK